MLMLALAATLIGFGLLVVALVTSQFAVAIACIVVCVVGLLLLLIDALRSGRTSSAGIEDEPLFHIRGDSSSRKRSAPLHDDDDDDDDWRAEAALRRERRDAQRGETPTTTTGGLGSLVAPPPGVDPGGPAAPVLRSSGPASGPITGQNPTGDANDYIRSVTGSLPSFAPASDPWPAANTPQAPRSGQSPAVGSPETTGPIPSDPFYVGRRRLGEFDTDSGPIPEQSDAVIRAPRPASDFHGDEGMVVKDNTGPLPSITYRIEDE